jgi:hypothetical protein
MKKLLATVICLIALIGSALPVSAQTRSRRNSRSAYDNRSSQTRYDNRYDRQYDRNNVRYQNEANRSDAYYDQYYDDRSVWEKHRDKITTGGGAVAGAIIGGLAGGKKGALIGAIVGGGGAAIYTYKIRNK